MKEDQISILVSTLNEGINHLSQVVKIQHPRIIYLVVFQNTKGLPIPEYLNREDITVLESKSTGLSKSRNLAISNCKTTYGLIADDDIEYIEKGIKAVLKVIDTRDLDFAFFKIRTKQGEKPYKDYPTNEQVINELRIISSIEMLLNIKSLKLNKLRFDERFGLGNYLDRGEEKILLFDMLRCGLKGFYFPIDLVIHPYESSGKIRHEGFKYYFFEGAFLTRMERSKNYKMDRTFFRLGLPYYLGKYYVVLSSIFKV